MKAYPVRPGIWKMMSANRYDLAMHFLRVQEFYECPNPRFRGKAFRILDYHEWYSKKHDNAFTYPQDWCGFNVPGEALRKLYIETRIPDFNKYDFPMGEFVRKMEKRQFNDPYYLIGHIKGDEVTLNHELAHAHYALDIKYKDVQDENVFKCNIAPQMQELLLEWGYSEKVINDEIQAYLSTGIGQEMKEYLIYNEFTDKDIEEACVPFIYQFEKLKNRKK